MRPLLQLVLLLSIGASAQASEVPISPLWGDLDPGRYEVGFKVLFLFDDTRSFATAGAGSSSYAGRPVRILLWYPARPSDKTAMTFGDVIRLSSGDRRFTSFNETLVDRDLDTAHRQFSPADFGGKFQSLMRVATAAHRDAPNARGRFPLVLHSLGRNNYQQESTVLWEFLASHGYVVANVPQLGSSPERSRLQFELADLETQARDLEYALAALVRAENVDSSKVSLLGHSSGGIAALLVATRNRNVDALVGLDSSTTTGEGAALVRSAGWWPAQSFETPALELYAGGKRGLDLSLLEELQHSEIYSAALGTGTPPTMATHFDFQNWPLFSLVSGEEDPRGRPARSAAYGARIYHAACLLTRMFLDATLREDTEALEALRTGVGLSKDVAEVVEVRYRGATSGSGKP